MIATPIISIRVKLGGSVTANQCAVTGQFVTMTNLGIVSTVEPIHTQTNNTSAVVIVPNTLSGSINTLKNLQIYNADTANATVTIEQYNNQDSSTRTVCTKTLIPNETLMIDNDGNISTLLDGATISHSTLANLTWTSSGHTGNASSVAYFAANGTAQHLTTNGTGSIVLTNNATLNTPNLTTPSYLNATNASGTAPNFTSGNVSFLNLSSNATNITGTLNVALGGTNLTASVLVTRQQVSNITGAFSSINTALPLDNTIPQITEGAEYLSVTIQPKDENSKIKINALMKLSTSTGAIINGALFKSGSNDALTVGQCSPAANVTASLPMYAEFTAGTTSNITITARAGTNAGNYVHMNSIGSGGIFGGAMTSSLIVEEQTTTG